MKNRFSSSRSLFAFACASSDEYLTFRLNELLDGQKAVHSIAVSHGSVDLAINISKLERAARQADPLYERTPRAAEEESK